ncbi:hypothetical protein BJ085DRAFT_39579, partial [Dimargaris cristalligena]
MVTTAYWDSALGSTSAVFQMIAIQNAATGCTAVRRQRSGNTTRNPYFYFQTHRIPPRSRSPWATPAPPQPTSVELSIKIRPQQITPAQVRLLNELLHTSHALSASLSTTTATSASALSPSFNTASQDRRENVAGLALAVSSLTLYYILNYTTSSLRSIEQIFRVPVPGMVRFTPTPQVLVTAPVPSFRFLDHCRFLLRKLESVGPGALWAGLSTSFLGQVAHIAYGHTYYWLRPPRISAAQNPALVLQAIAAAGVAKVMQLVAAVPFYPFWHLSVVWRLHSLVQSRPFQFRLYAREYWRLLKLLVRPPALATIIQRPSALFLEWGLPAIYPAFIHRLLFDYIQTKVVFPRVHRAFLGMRVFFRSFQTTMLEPTSEVVIDASNEALFLTDVPGSEGDSPFTQPARPVPLPPTQRTMLRQFYAELASVL